MRQAHSSKRNLAVVFSANPVIVGDMKPLSTSLRLGALLLGLATVGFWALRGAHAGWTQTSVTTMRIDEVTGLEYPERTDRFVPGLDFLAGALGLTIGMGAASLWTARRSRSQRTA